MWNLFKMNNKDQRCSGVFIIIFEQSVFIVSFEQI